MHQPTNKVHNARFRELCEPGILFAKHEGEHDGHIHMHLAQFDLFDHGTGTEVKAGPVDPLVSDSHPLSTFILDGVCVYGSCSLSC